MVVDRWNPPRTAKSQCTRDGTSNSWMALVVLGMLHGKDARHQHQGLSGWVGLAVVSAPRVSSSGIHCLDGWFVFFATVRATAIFSSQKHAISIGWGFSSTYFELGYNNNVHRVRNSRAHLYSHANWSGGG